jgi:hypothetical protein
MEDCCSILDLPTSAKYDGTIERIARALRPLSTNPAADLNILFRRAVFAWLIADGDMHLKNLAVLKTADADAKTFTAVRFAPMFAVERKLVASRRRTFCGRAAFDHLGGSGHSQNPHIRKAARSLRRG